MANLKCIPEGWYQLSEGMNREDKVRSITDTLIKYKAVHKIFKHEGEIYVLIPMSVHEDHSLECSYVKSRDIYGKEDKPCEV